MIEFSVEPFASVEDEIQPIWRRHWQEVGEDRDRIALDPDVDGYRALQAAGRLHVVTARRAGALVGYVFALVGPHLHYRSTIFASLDLYWLERKCRGGRTAARLFVACEQSLRDRGVTKVVGNTKLAADQGRLFAALGWREAERIFVKVI